MVKKFATAVVASLMCLFSASAMSNEPDHGIESQLIPVKDYCSLVGSHPITIRLLKAILTANEAHAGVPALNYPGQFYKSDLITDWIDEKLRAGMTQEQLRANYEAYQNNERVLDNYMANVRSTCGRELADSNKVIFDFQASEQSNWERVEGSYKQCKSNKVKKIADDGSIKEVEPTCDSETADYYKFIVDHLILPKVLAFKNGDKVLQNAAGESVAKLEADVNQAVASKKQEDAEKIAQANAQKSNDKARIARINQMRSNGNYSSAQSCSEVAEAMRAIQIGGLPTPLVSPDKKAYYLAARLDEFNGNSGYILDSQSGAYAGISVTKNTLWFSKEKIQMKAGVLVVGRYVNNGNVTLVSGAGQPIRIYDVMCIQPLALTDIFQR